MMTKRVVIIGGMAAGMKTAARLRRLDAQAEIVVLERGQQLSYGACGAPYFIGGEVRSISSLDHTPQGIARDSSYFRLVKGVDARCGCDVQQIDRQRKCVVYSEAGIVKEIAYDVLVLATGSTPIRLNLPQADTPGIHSFWLSKDVQEVDELFTFIGYLILSFGCVHTGSSCRKEMSANNHPNATFFRPRARTTSSRFSTELPAFAKYPDSTA